MISARSDGEPAEPAQGCPNCGTERLGSYCHQCGQKYTAARLSIRHVVEDALSSFFNLEGTVPRTIRGLSTNPGRLGRDYGTRKE